MHIKDNDGAIRKKQSKCQPLEISIGASVEDVVLMRVPEVICAICTCRADPTVVHIQLPSPRRVMK